MHRRSGRRSVLAALVIAIVAVGVGGILYGMGFGRSLPPITGEQLDSPVPDIPLVSASGAPTSVAALQGRYVVLTPFLTLCHEVCPITTGAYLELSRALAAAGLSSKVSLVEATVDPGRDTPDRLRAYAKLTGADWTMLTGTPADIARLWQSFGVDSEQVPLPTSGPGATIDWYTKQPETYDVAHSDGVFIIDPQGHWRIVDIGGPDVGGKLDPTLTAMLDAQGLQNLRSPQAAWTVQQVLDDLGHLMGRSIPAPTD
jgi:cytochrome oxidase Cu insertion factor (SCO1/SenC/PrrC family)